MNQIKLLLNESIDEQIAKYLLTISGINTVNVNNQELTIKYDEQIISLKVIKLEVYLFLDLNFPSILMFDKNYNTQLIIKEYTIADICCKICLLGKIEDLLFVPGIIKVTTDYDFINKYHVRLMISYDEKKITWSEIVQLISNN